jgi:hypothetical protein
MHGDEHTFECIYTRLIELSREAFASSLYITAYHTLAAALPCACTAAQLAEIEAIAQEQMDCIDTHAPTHYLSSESLAAHNRANLWAALESHARRKRWLVERDTLLEQETLRDLAQQPAEAAYQAPDSYPHKVT